MGHGGGGRGRELPSFREAYRMLVKPGDGPVSRHLNRHISIRLTLFLLRHGLAPSPTAMSIINFLAGLSAGAFFALGWPLLGGLMAQASSVLDGCDGEIARLTGRTSRGGGIIDAILDRVADTSVVAGASVYALYHGRPPGWPGQFPWSLLVVLLLALSLSGSMAVSYCSAIFRALAGSQPRRLVGTRDVRLFLMMLAGLAALIVPWAVTAGLALLVLLTWAEVAGCLIQAGRLGK